MKPAQYFVVLLLAVAYNIKFNPAAPAVPRGETIVSQPKPKPRTGAGEPGDAR